MRAPLTFSRFQALIGTVETSQDGTFVQELQEFQALIGTVETEIEGIYLDDTEGFKPS